MKFNLSPLLEHRNAEAPMWGLSLGLLGLKDCRSLQKGLKASQEFIGLHSVLCCDLYYSCNSFFFTFPGTLEKEIV